MADIVVPESYLRATLAAQLASGIMAANGDNMDPKGAVDLFKQVQAILATEGWRFKRPGSSEVTTD